MLTYAISKFAVYSAWCYLGLYLLAGRASLFGALKFGAMRWCLGLVFGFAAAIFLGSVSEKSVATLYVGVYVPLRIVEWSIMAVLLTRGEPALRIAVRNPKSWLWVAGGIAVSFASDLLSPEGMAGRFCVGRCLC